MFGNMKMMNKFAAVLLAFVLAVSVMPAQAHAASGGTERVTVVVLLDEGMSPYAAANRMAAATPGMKIKYIYGTLINGFAAEINASDSAKVAGYIGVKSLSKETVYALPKSDVSGARLEFAEGSVKISLRADETGGAGIIVAVLDSGFDVSHPVFRMSNSANAPLKKSDIATLRPRLKAKSAGYVSPKIPFAYDYSDGDDNVYMADEHGTGVAGIIAGNGGNYEGVAPEAQLLLMKVFGNWGTSNESAVIAALEDAVTLGADVINLSLGSAVGADNGYPLAPALGEALSRASELGITVNAAAGNDGHIGFQSTVSNEIGAPLPTTSVVDYGTISSPASVGSVNAVASKNSAAEYEYYIDFDGKMVPFSDTTQSYKDIGGGKSFTELLDGKTYKYVAVPGLGTLEDCAEVADELKGAVALIKRGKLTFVEKVNNAHAYGAIAAVVWDNVEDNPESVGMELTGARIPAVFIKHKYGVELAEKGSGTVTIKDKLLGKFPTEDYGKISETSSWGVTPGFSLKPDFASTGINVATAAPDKKFSTMSGTSAASAYASGEAAALYATLRKNGGSPDSKEITRRLMNTAELLTDPETGIYYSPRRQGAGEAKAKLAAASDIALLDASTDKAKTAVSSLGGTSLSLVLTIENESDEEKTISLACSVQGDEYTVYTSEDESYTANINLCVPHAFDKASAVYDGHELNIYSEAFKGAEITLGAGEKKQLTIEITLDEETAQEYGSVFEHGFYLEGFVIADDGHMSVSLPYVAFTGNWDALPIFDATIYDTDAVSYYGQSYFYGISGDLFTEIALGKNWFTEDAEINSGLIAFSPNGDGEADELYLSLALLRSARDVSGVITDAEGNVVVSYDDTAYVGKSIALENTFSVVDLMVWDGSAADNPYYILPDGMYTLTLTAYPAFEGSTAQTFEYSFAIDTKFPALKSAKLVKDKSGVEMLEVTVSDDRAIQGAMMYINIAGYYAGIFDYAHTKGQKTADTYRFSVDGWRESEMKHVYLDIYDYAMNRTTVRVSLEQLAAGKGN